MSNRTIDGRALISVLLVTLLIRVLAWGAVGPETVQAGHPNQTIPTPTPSRVPGTRVTKEPTKPPSTREPTSPPGESSATPVPSPSVPASPTPTARPTGSPPVATPTATEAEPSATPAPVGTTSTSLPIQPVTTTSMPPLPTNSPAIAPGAPSASSLPTDALIPGKEDAPSPAPSAKTQPATSALTPSPQVSTGATLLSSSCLWIGLGLLLIIAGIVVLVRWRLFS